MGEVYRARDIRLARDVAIKVLPEALASDQERLRRFEKEARSASALNHQNIVTIYDVGSESGVSYIAMEIVEGVTLRELLPGGPLPVKRLMQIAPQVAEGLARAHEAGIVHRDLKPENVMVKKDGLVKILDFGLAKLSSTGSDSDEVSQLQTMTGTNPGVVVGTVSYMSPEQASGQPLDFRSDQFSLGSMLYEMATGRRAFQKKTAIDTLSAILNEEPEPLSVSAPQVPAPLRWLVERCLAKEPQGRYASTQDLARDLSTLRDHLSESISSGSLGAATGGRVARRKRALPVLGAIAAAVVLIAMGLLAGRWLTARGAGSPVPTFRQLTFRRGNLHQAKFAPDGRTVVYAAAWDGAPAELYTVRTDSTESHAMGISQARVTSVSSKGELAVILQKNTIVWSGGTLARVPIGGGTPREILENVYDASWAPNGEDLAVVLRSPEGDFEVQYPIGTTLAEGAVEWARVSPTGDLVAFMEGDALCTIDRKGKRKVISRGWLDYSQPFWSPGGGELILAGSRLAETAAVYSVSLSGRERVLINLAPDLNLLDVASDGRLLVEYAWGEDNLGSRSRGGNHEREIVVNVGSGLSDISEDGQLLLVGEAGSVLLRKSDGTPAIRLGQGEGQAISADGRSVLAILKGPPRELVWLPTGPGATRKIPVEGVEPLEAVLLPKDKGFLVVARGKGESPVDLFLVGPDGGKPRPFPAEGHVGDRAFLVSPEGDRLAYVAKDSQVRIASLQGGQVTAISGAPIGSTDFAIQWSADAQFLYLYTPGGGGVPGRIDRLELATGRREPWKELMPADPTGVDVMTELRISRDGQAYAYGYARILISRLFVIEGVR
jgi:eukaryotic-like serine/threonine-protein kinase